MVPRPEGLRVLFKQTQFTKKPSWQTVAFAGLVPFCKTINEKGFERGERAIWLQPILTDNNGTAYPWMILDIEAPGALHADIGANLEAGREFLRIICEHGVEAELVIFLSGKGLRFCWPYVVPTDLKKAFFSFIQNAAEFPMLDPAPFTKKSFYRLFANRCHSNQGAILHRHVHRLAHVQDLWSLSAEEYLTLVAGTIDMQTSIEWLGEIMPRGFIPEPWRQFLEAYRRSAILSDTIFRPIIQRRKSRKPIAHLATLAGIEFRQFQFARGNGQCGPSFDFNRRPPNPELRLLAKLLLCKGGTWAIKESEIERVKRSCIEKLGVLLNTPFDCNGYWCGCPNSGPRRG